MTDREQQLLHLVDRARRGVALPEELDQLATGVGALDQLRADLDRVQQAACRTAETLRHAEDRIVKADAALAQVEAVATRWEKYGSTDLRTAARVLRAEVLDQAQQPTTNPAAAVEVRQPCSYCDDHQMIPRRQYAEHVARLHPTEQSSPTA